MNPFIRHSLLSIFLGGGFFMMSAVVSQPLFQRYVSCKTLRTAQVATWLCYLVNVMFSMLVYAVGLVAFAYFTCDPLITSEISKSEQLVPYMVMKTMSLPGITGLFLACTFSGSLSTISSGINSISLVIIVDFVCPLRRSLGKPELTGARIALFSKLIALIVGILMIGTAFLCDRLGTLIVQITMSIGGMFVGPCFGVMLVAMFTRFVNSTGAVVGFIVSTVVITSIGFGSAAFGVTSYSPKLPLSTHGCNMTDVFANMSETTTTASWYSTAFNITELFPSPTEATTTAGFVEIFRLSYLLYGLLSTTVCVVVAMIVSLCTKCGRDQEVDPRLIFSFSRAWNSEDDDNPPNMEYECSNPKTSETLL